VYSLCRLLSFLGFLALVDALQLALGRRQKILADAGICGTRKGACGYNNCAGAMEW